MNIKLLKILAIISFILLVISILIVEFYEPKLYQILFVVLFTILFIISLIHIKRFNNIKSKNQ